ncbi:MAG: hypothetical protein N2Z62_00900 [Rhodobacteraceae bacterium]|nr:hypothetical protein [Paracoccaceae bacterium]
MRRTSLFAILAIAATAGAPGAEERRHLVVADPFVPDILDGQQSAGG